MLGRDYNLYPYKDLYPKINETVFLAPGVKIIGDVSIGDQSSVWYNSVIRGDVHYIKIGHTTNIQDCSMLHVTNNKFSLNIGNLVTIGHSVKLHGCIIEDLTFLGIGAIVLDGAVVETNSMVAAGSVVKPGFRVPSGMLVGGVPGRILRKLSEKELEDIEASAYRYKKYSEITLNSLSRK